VILASTVFDWSTRVTDRQTDGRTDGLAWFSHFLRHSAGNEVGLFYNVPKPTWGVWPLETFHYTWCIIMLNLVALLHHHTHRIVDQIFCHLGGHLPSFAVDLWTKNL